MTPEQVGRATPYEINVRANGYARRLNNEKLLIGSLLTVPIINGGSRAPKSRVTVEKLFPEAFKNTATKQDIERAIDLVKRAERGDFSGQS
ncbi:MAG: hypothetical protein SPI25_05250 [Dialister sp.]|nr:hypothetical protein [Dialister sp.]